MLGYLGFLCLLFLPGLSALLVLGQEHVGLVSLLSRSYGLSRQMEHVFDPSEELLQLKPVQVPLDQFEFS